MNLGNRRKKDKEENRARRIVLGLVPLNKDI